MDPTIHSVEEIYAQLSPDNERILISMPYRIGLYLSHADTTGGWEAQDAEFQSLALILREFSEDFCKTEFTQRVLMDALKCRSDWPGWGRDIGNVPAEIAQLNDILTPMFMPRELSGFKDVMLDIALAVAMAFREEKSKGTAPSLLGGLLGRLSVRKAPLDHINISPREREALNRVCGAMKHVFHG